MNCPNCGVKAMQRNLVNCGNCGYIRSWETKGKKRARWIIAIIAFIVFVLIPIFTLTEWRNWEDMPDNQYYHLDRD